MSKFYKIKYYTVLNLLVFISCFAVGMLFSGKLYAEPKKYLSVESYLQDQSTIRIYITRAPGFGHQVASYNLMLRLRALGFHGTFEVIYDSEEPHSGEVVTRNKVITLFNLPNDLPPVYEDIRNKIRFIAMKVYIEQLNNHLIPIVNLGMTGGRDIKDFCEFSDDPNENNAACLNDARFMQVKTFIRLNPNAFTTDSTLLNYLKKAFPNFVYPIYISSFDKPSIARLDENWKTYLITPIPTLSDAKNEITHHSVYLNDKKSYLLTLLIDKIENENINVMSVYGWSFLKENDQIFPANILQVISGARYAQLIKPSEFQNKPLVIIVYYGYEKEILQLKKLIYNNDWEEYSGIDGIEQMKMAINQLNLANVLFMSDTHDNQSIEDAVNRLKNLKNGDIFLLAIGSLPKRIFDGIYNHTGDNVLPAMREGANSFNTLIQTGRPHFHCDPHVFKHDSPYISFSNWEDINFIYVKDAILKSKSQYFYNRQNGFCTGNRGWQESDFVYKYLGDFIVSAKDPHSTFSQYFVDFQTEVLKLENDRIYQALEYIISH